MRELRGWLLAAALLAPAAASAQLPQVFIGTFDTEAAEGLDPAGVVEVTLRLHPRASARAAGLGRWFPTVRVEGDRATFQTHGYPVARDRPGKPQRMPSFYVDFDEPAVQSLRPAVVGKHGRSPGIADLSAFVDAHLARKSMGRLLDPASVAATRGEGDCTEHAVLMAAVARLFGHPARIVHGLAVVRVGERWTALGHAWTEVHDGRAWRLVDATRPPPGTILYVPLGAIEDEGPGYAAASLRSLNPLDVARVELAPVKG